MTTFAQPTTSAPHPAQHAQPGQPNQPFFGQHQANPQQAPLQHTPQGQYAYPQPQYAQPGQQQTQYGHPGHQQPPQHQQGPPTGYPPQQAAPPPQQHQVQPLPQPQHPVQQPPQAPAEPVQAQAQGQPDADLADKERDSAKDDGPSLYERIKAGIAEHRESFPQLVTEPQPSLADRIDYSANGPWTTQVAGRSRSLHKLYTYVVAVPTTAVAYTVAWAAERPARLAALLTIVVVLSTALNMIPLINAVIPDWLSLTTWPPFCWLG